MVSNVLDIDQVELVHQLKSFKTKYAQDTEWDQIRAGFPKSWPRERPVYLFLLEMSNR